MRRGSVLLFSLIVMAITVHVTGAISSYYVNTANLAKFYSDRRDARRIGASRTIRNAIDKVMERVEELSGKIGDTTSAAVTLPGAGVAGQSLDSVLDKLKTAVESVSEDERRFGGETYDLSAEAKVAEKALYVTVSYAGSVVASAKIELESAATSNTLPVFDYVYFADNNGRLNSSYIIANGDVGSNGDFDLTGATVNGYVRYLNSMRLTGDPHAWLQGAYMAKIAAEFKIANTDQNTIEQARPTNPIIYEDGGKSQSADWPGGYECVYASNPYSFNETPPVPVAAPGSEPQKPSDVEYRQTTSKNNPF